MDYIIAILLSLGNIGAYAILAVGIVMIYRASQVLNLAHGAMAMIPAYIVYTLHSIGIPALVAFPLGLIAGGLLGYLVERTFIRRLRAESTTAQTVGTVAAFGLLVAGAAKIWGTTPLPAVQIFPEGFVEVGQSSIKYGEFGLFVVMAVVTFGLYVLFTKTDLGLVMRGTAENRRAASLMGVDPDKITALAWILGGSLAALAGILLASNSSNIEPYVLSFQALFGFVAALMAGLTSLPAAVGGAVIVGVVLGLVPVLGPLGDIQGAPQLVLAIIGVAAMVYRGRKIATGTDVRAGLAGKVRGGGLAISWRDLPGRRVFTIVGIALFFFVPFVVDFALLGSINKAAIFTIVAVSLVVLTGWVGQISLGHAAFVGIGGYVTGLVAQGLGIPFPINLPFAVAAGALIAVGLGAVAVRVRGLYLAVATLILSWTASEFLFRQEWFTRHATIDSRPIGQPGTFPYFDFADRKVFYFVAWAVALACIYGVANLRTSKTGRAFFAIQGSEVAAASLGIDVVRYKVLAFSISGGLAAAAGALTMTEARNIVPDQFDISNSLLFLSVAVVGGLSSLPGAVAAGVIFASLDYLFFKVQAFSGLLDITSAVLLVVVLLAYQGGIAALGQTVLSAIAKSKRLMKVLRVVDRVTDQVGEDVGWARMQMKSRRRKRLLGMGFVVQDENSGFAVGELSGSEPDNSPTAVPTDETQPLKLADVEARNRLGRTAETVIGSAGSRIDSRVVLSAHEVTVRFGGLTAVNSVTLEVREGEIVGLIGPNGAGKSVTFNAVAGLVQPQEGKITINDIDAGTLSVHERAKLGVARTFQAIQLFAPLSVEDNLLVATHLHNETGWVSHVGVTHKALTAERDAREIVKGVIERMGLKDVAHRRVGDLPFGVLRIVEVARALTTGFPFIMLDEPASGLDGGETEALTEVLRKLRDEEGATLLLIEHDVKMVTSVSDYMYVLDRGTMIAQGHPDVVKRDPGVIAAYLGKPIEEMVGV